MFVLSDGSVYQLVHEISIVYAFHCYWDCFVEPDWVLLIVCHHVVDQTLVIINIVGFKWFKQKGKWQFRIFQCYLISIYVFLQKSLLFVVAHNYIISDEVWSMSILWIQVMVIFLVNRNLKINWSIRQFYFWVRAEIAKNESFFRLKYTFLDYEMAYLYFSRLN